MNQPRTLADEVANNETQLHHLRLKSQSDDATITLLQSQNKTQADELTRIMNHHALEIQALRQDRDEALTKATQVDGIIQSICELGLDGLRKMKEKPVTADTSLQELARRIPAREPVEPNRIPRLAEIEKELQRTRPLEVQRYGRRAGPSEHPLLPRAEEATTEQDDPSPTFLRQPAAR